MQIKINYPEIQDAVAMRFNKQIVLCYVDAATVEIAYTIRMFGLSKSIRMNLKIERIEGTDLYLSYYGSLGLDFVVSNLLSFIKGLMPEKTGFIQEQGNYTVMIRLAEIDKLEKALEMVRLKQISFDNDGVIADVVMK